MGEDQQVRLLIFRALLWTWIGAVVTWLVDFLHGLWHLYADLGARFR